MTDEEQKELAKTIVQLLRTDETVRCAVWDAACRCPNLVVQY